MQAITRDCRSLTLGIHLGIKGGKQFWSHIVDERPRGVEVLLGHKWFIVIGYMKTRNNAIPF